jgi:hypothetical protein
MEFDPNGELASYLREAPIGYAPFRVMHIYAGSGQDAMAERQEVPFFSNVFFPLLLSGYVILRRLLAPILGGGSSVQSADQLFTMTSGSEYKTHSFLEVAERLIEEGETVVFLCSPAAEENRTEWEARGFETVTFQELLGSVPLVELARGFVQTSRVILRLRKIYPEGYEAAPLSLLFNVTFLETVKTAALNEVTDEPVVHTYAPMPYLLNSTRRDRVLTYQHGSLLAHSKENIAEAYPFFIPLTYLVWGEQWRKKLLNRAHPDSEIIITGSPWHDQLVERDKSEGGPPEWDVLFISATHGLADEAEIKTYESLVSELIEECESRGWSLAIKLHPGSTGQWYYDRDWGEYVRTFDGILDAVSSSRVAVTDASSAMIESALMGTPILVTEQLNDTNIQEQISMSSIHFVDPGNLGSAIESLLTEAKRGEQEIPSFADGTAVNQIVAVALNRPRTEVASTERSARSTT